MEEMYKMEVWSDDFVRAIKAAHESGDGEMVAAMIKPFVIRQTRRILWADEFRTFFPTEEDKRQAIQEMWFFCYSKIAWFLSNPENDPDSDSPVHYCTFERIGFWKKTILRALGNLRNREGRNVRTVPLVVPSNDDGDKDNTTTDVPSGENLEEKIIARERLGRTFKTLFSLEKHRVDTLVSVAFVILDSFLSPKKRSMDAYGDHLNQQSVEETMDEVEGMLQMFSLDKQLLAPLKKRLEKEREKEAVRTWTGPQLSNRKTTILQLVRKKMDQQDNE